jgi:hypothetical protein
MTYRVICNYTQPSEKDFDKDVTHEHLVRRTFSTLDKAQHYLKSVAPSRNPKILLELTEDDTDIPMRDRAALLMKQLDRMLLDWEPDGSVPRNLVRKTGSGKTICEVNRWCGGFQSTHEPTTIGWKVAGYRGGVLLVSEYETTDDAMQAAQWQCDEILKANCKGKYEMGTPLT